MLVLMPLAWQCTVLERLSKLDIAGGVLRHLCSELGAVQEPLARVTGWLSLTHVLEGMCVVCGGTALHRTTWPGAGRMMVLP